eukprot:2824539-Ditylum_brightwellii.AAC.1
MSRYGKERWREIIRCTAGMRKYVSINQLVQHMHNKMEKVFKCTTHECTWKFYHDALSLMSAKECCFHMEHTGILKRWILPEEGLNKKEKYKGRLIRDCPEMNALDTNLNKDIHDGVHRHISKTRTFPDDDNHKFSIMTEKKGVLAYL